MTEFNTPILFLIFNRPEITQKVFAKIREQKPKYLYIAADGARKNKEAEKEKCELTRKLVLDSIDWDCEVETLFRDKNLGCGRAVSQAINWFFENVEQGIILEDDCLPNHSFFNFCEVLLEKYKDNNKVFMVNGNNFQNDIQRGDTDYYFSIYPHIWGWATWRRAWQHYDFNMSDFDEEKLLKTLKKLSKNPYFSHYWLNIMRKIYSNEIDTWDYQWTYTIWKYYKICITPNLNLVSNIGFGKDATHTKDNSPLANQQSFTFSENFTHPYKIITHKQADNYISSKIFHIPQRKKLIVRLREKIRLRTRIQNMLTSR